MLTFLLEFIRQYGLFGVALSVFIESIGVPLPTEPAYIVGQALINRGEVSFLTIQAVLISGQTIGCILSYKAGRRLASGFKKSKNLNATQQKLALWYDKYGYAAVFGARLIGYVRPWSSYVAGIAEVPFWPFLILSTMGSIIINILTLAFTNQMMYLWVHVPIVRVAIVLSLSVGFVLVLSQAYTKHAHLKRV